MILAYLQKRKAASQRTLALLCDPDDMGHRQDESVKNAIGCGVELFLVGGSLVSQGETSACVKRIKQLGAAHVLLFPGHEIQIAEEADGILFMSLISGRNPEFLIGKQVHAAPRIKRSGMESIPSGYMLIDGGKITSAHYMSASLPIPADKSDIAAATAMAGEMLGHQVIYMDAGSGAIEPIPVGMVQAVRQSIDGVLFVGGGIRTALQAEDAWNSGANVVVVGNGAFENPEIIADLAIAASIMNNTKAKVY